jgi:DNA-binding NarL/FixJ family response regulator
MEADMADAHRCGAVAEAVRTGESDPLPPEELLSPAEWRRAVKSLQLSEQQARIAALMLRGWEQKAVAAELAISPNTVRVHRKLLYAKARVRQQVQLVLALVAAGRDGRQGASHE